MPTIHKRTLYPRRTQEKAIKALAERGYIKRIVKGMPRRQWYKILKKEQFAINNTPVCHILQTSMSDIADKNVINDKPVCQKLHTSMSDVTLIKTREVRLDNKTRVEEEKTPTTQPPRIDKDNKVVKLYKSKFGLPNTKVCDDIKNAIVLYGEEWCYEALKYSIGKNKYGWNYANGTLKGWSAEHPSTSKPWEMMMYANGNRKHIKQSEVDWENEPDGII